jgi:hypothetical protein
VTLMLSVAATCTQQQCSLLDYLTAVCTAALHGQPRPSLVTSSGSRHRGLNSYSAKSLRIQFTRSPSTRYVGRWQFNTTHGRPTG